MRRAQLTLSLSYAGMNEKEFSWRRRKESKDILDRQQILNHVCRFYTNARKPNGIPLIGYVQVSNCGTHKSYIYPKKLCCYYHVITIFQSSKSYQIWLFVLMRWDRNQENYKSLSFLFLLLRSVIPKFIFWPNFQTFVCVTEQHYVSIFFTRLWSVRSIH